jgi:tetratricopeptide (TPR) repeat protein
MTKKATTPSSPTFSRISSPTQSEINVLFDHYQKGQYGHAENIAKGITNAYPSHPFAWKILGAVLKQTDRLSEAVIANQRAVEISPNDAESHSNLGLILQDLGKLPDALTCFQRALALKPDFPEAHNNIGNTLQELGRLEEAKVSYQKAILLKPDYAEAYSNLGTALKEFGQLEEAEATYYKAIALNPDYAEARYNLGNTLKELNRLEEAEVIYKKVLGLKPGFAQAHYNLGNTLAELNRFDEARSSYQNALKLKPDFVEALFSIAMLHISLNQIEDSIQFLKKVIEIDSDIFHLKAAVKLAVFNFLENDLNAAQLLIQNSKKILSSETISAKNEVAYHIFLDRLISQHKINNYRANNEFEQKLHVIGESHSLSSHGLNIEKLKGGSNSKIHWIIGCKQWHLGNSSPNQYKKQFEKIVHTLPHKSLILLAIGEIDCRINDGILKHIKNNPIKIQSELIQSTIDNYLLYIFNITNIKSMHVIIQGIPCPNIIPEKVEKNDHD